MTSPAPNADRERELAALLEVSRAMLSTLELKPLLELILDRLKEIVPYHGASVMLGDDGVMRQLAVRRPHTPGVSDEPDATPRETRFEDFSVMWERIRLGEYVIIDDVWDDTPEGREYRNQWGGDLRGTRVEYVHSFLNVSLVVRDEMIGVVSLAHSTPGFFREEHAHLVRAFADQAALAIENARLFEDARRRSTELSALLEVSNAVVSTLDLRQLLGVILDQLKDIIDHSGSAFVLIDGDSLVVRDSRAMSGAEDEIGVRVPLAAAKPIWSAVEGGGLIIGDIRSDEPAAVAIRGILQSVGAFDVPPIAQIRSWMAVPVVVKNQVIGMITVSDVRPDRFREEHISLVRAFADQAALAIENARLFDQAERRTSELSGLLEVSRTIASTLDAREVLAAILDQLSAITEHTGASILLFREDALEFVEARSITGVHAQTGARIPYEVAPTLSAVMRKGEAVIIDDVRADDPLAADYLAAISSIGLSSQPPFNVIRSWMSIPLELKGRILGAITISWTEPSYFTQDHARIARVYADQAALAIENASLFEQAESRARELAGMLEVALALTSTVELRPLMELVLDKLYDFVPYAGASINLVRDDQFVQLAVRRPRGPPVVPEDLMAVLPISTYGRERLTNEVLLIDDVHGDTPDAIAYRSFYGGDLRGTRVEYIRSFMNLALTARGKLVGVLSVAHDEPGYFKQSHVDLLRPLASQAAVVLENATLFEQAESQARELGALLAVSGAVAATLDLRQLMTIVLDNLHAIVEHSGSAFVLRDGDTLVIHDARSIASTKQEIGARMSLGAAGGIWDAITKGREVIIADIRSDEPMAVSYRAAIGSMGLLEEAPFILIRSWMAVPLKVKDDVVGMITMSAPEPGHFNPDHARLAAALAGQVSIAIENARLFDQAELRARETDALYRSDELLFRSLDLDDVLQALADVAVDLVGSDKSTIWVWDPAANRMRTRATRNFSDEALAEMKDADIHKGSNYPGEIIVIENTSENVHATWRDILVREGVRRYAEVTLASPSGEVLGSFACGYTTDHTLTDNERRMLHALGERAAMAISNAGLHENARRITALEERQRLARELHDSVSQALYGIALGARTARALVDRDPSKLAEPLDYVLSLAEAGLAEMRALIFELRPESLETEGLVAALEKQVAATGARYGIAVTADLGTEPDASIDVKECLYRIGQEALHNMVKHANATEASVTLRGADGAVELIVRDNGQGFDTEGDFAGHLGLRSMRERCARIGGEVQIESEVGTGTTIRARVRSR